MLRVLLLLVRVWHFVRSTIGAMSTRVYLPWRVTWRDPKPRKWFRGKGWGRGRGPKGVGAHPSEHAAQAVAHGGERDEHLSS